MIFEDVASKILIFLLLAVGSVGCDGIGPADSSRSSDTGCQKPHGTYTVSCTSVSCVGAGCMNESCPSDETFTYAAGLPVTTSTVSSVWSDNGCQQDIKFVDDGSQEETVVVCDMDGSTCDSTDVSMFAGVTLTTVSHWTINKN
jgi:hypothetical protein